MSANIEKTDNISELTTWDMVDTVSIPDGYDHKSIPEATSANMEILMNKINELTGVVNQLTVMNGGLINALKGKD